MTRSITPPPNLHIFGTERPETFRLKVDGLPLAIHGQSFRKADTRTTSPPTTSRPRAASTSPCSTPPRGRLRRTRALCALLARRTEEQGHGLLGARPRPRARHPADEPYIAFSGNTQGRHIHEPGARGALLVRVANGVVQPPERLFVDVLRWKLVEVDVAGTENMDEAMGRVRDAFERVIDTADGRPVAGRVCLKGKTAAHGALLAQPRAVRADVQAQAGYVDADNLWIEKIEVDTAPPRDPAEIAARADGLADLQALLAEAPADAEFIASMKKEFGPLLDKLPPEAYNGCGGAEAVVPTATTPRSSSRWSRD